MLAQKDLRWVGSAHYPSQKFKRRRIDPVRLRLFFQRPESGRESRPPALPSEIPWHPKNPRDQPSISSLQSSCSSPQGHSSFQFGKHGFWLMGATGLYSNPCSEASAERTGSSTNPWHPLPVFSLLKQSMAPLVTATLLTILMEPRLNYPIPEGGSREPKCAESLGQNPRKRGTQVPTGANQDVATNNFVVTLVGTTLRSRARQLTS